MKIGTKITGVCLVLITLSTATFLATLLVQRGRLTGRMKTLVQQQAHNESEKIIRTLYYDCVNAEVLNQSRLTHDLAIAREMLNGGGRISFDSATEAWDAVNQTTHEVFPVRLPRFLIGGAWLGKNAATNKPSPIVDKVSHVTRDHCTIFQRMNEEGDMLRIDTSVITTDGARAIGTYISHQNGDGSPNAVIAAVLKGETYRGRAFVVNEYHDAAYEPIWDANHSRVIGMLYVGVSLKEINKQIHDSTTNIVVGKTGYVYVLDSKGTYIISQAGKRDGESIWNAKDSDGNLVIQSIVGKARGLSEGACASQTYSWKNSEDPVPRQKFAVFTYFAPWDWIVAGGAYEDDYYAINSQVEAAMSNLVKITSLTALCMGLLGLAASYFVSIGIARPVMSIVNRLNCGVAQTASAAGHISASSQALAEGASGQAASIEETGASLEQMASVTKRNAEDAGKANDLARQTRAAAENSAANVKEMSVAMEAIKASSSDISKIIKTIDEIAFQTNILALNAAVEAARAGETGAGFAVVADEVRNLAQRSASAAKETAEKIEAAITKTARGAEISAKVAKALEEIVVKAREVDGLAEAVSTASREQSRGVTQISSAVGQIDQVTQNNAASAEESAAAAEQLNAQAYSIKEIAEELSEIVCGQRDNGSPPAAQSIYSSTARNGEPEPGRKASNVISTQSSQVPLAAGSSTNASLN